MNDGFERFQADHRMDHLTLRVGEGMQTWRYIDTGADGPTLVMLPGGLGNGAIFWHQIAALGARLRIISVTYPSLPEIDPLVDGLAAFLDQLGMRRINLLGTSLGGMVARAFAARHPGRIETLFICNTPYYPRGLAVARALMRWMPRKWISRGLERNVRRIDRERPEFGDAKDILLRNFVATPRQDELVARLTASTLPAAPGAAIPGDRVVIIGCDDDPASGGWRRDRLIRAHPGAGVHILPCGGHMPYLTVPDEFNRIITDNLG